MKPVFRIFYPSPEGLGAFHTAMAEAKRRHPLQAIRAPHHTSSIGSMAGVIRWSTAPDREGIAFVSPGECLLADGGVLILDELPEFPRAVVEAVAEIFHRQAVHLLLRGETGAGRQIIEIPARFSVYATAQRCPCGLLGDACRCGDAAIERFNDRAYAFQARFEEE